MPEDSNSARLSIILPVLNVAAELQASLQALQALRERGHELLVVDGGSRDGTVTLARKFADRVLLSGTGRSLQKNTGGENASNDILLFLSVQARLPAAADSLIVEALQSQRYQWGQVDWASDEPSGVKRAMAALQRIAGMATDSTSLFVTRPLFERVRGFDSVEAGEDAALAKKLRGFAKPLHLRATANRQT